MGCRSSKGVGVMDQILRRPVPVAVAVAMAVLLLVNGVKVAAEPADEFMPVRIENFLSTFAPYTVYKSATFEELAAYAREMGLASIRVGIRWDQTEPFQGVYNWSMFDQRVETANRLGLRVHGLITRTPWWAEDPALTSFRTPRPELLAQFAATLVERYNGNGIDDAIGSDGRPLVVEAWEVSHEPDYRSVWDAANPTADYARAYRAAVAAARAVDPGIAVMTGGLSARGTTQYLRRVFDNLEPQELSAFLPVHLYRFPNSPESAVGGRYAKQSLLDRIVEFKREIFDVYAPGRPMRLWIGALGWPSWPSEPLPTTAYVTDEVQADYLVRAIVLALSTQLVEGIAIACQLVDNTVCSSTPWTEMGVVRADGTPKPSYQAIRTAVEMLRGADYAGSEYLGPENYALHFARGEEIITVLWNASHHGTSSESLVELDAGDPGAIRLVDRDGEELEVTLRAGRAVLTLSGRPRYLVRRGIDVVPAPVVVPARVTGTPGGTIRLNVPVLNPFPRSLSGTFTLQLPQGWDAEEVGKPYHLAPAGLEILEFVVTPPREARTGEVELIGRFSGPDGTGAATAAWVSLARMEVVTDFRGGLEGWRVSTSDAQGGAHLSTEVSRAGRPSAKVSMRPDPRASGRLVQIARSAALPVPGEPYGFGVWVYGDDSGCQINYQVVDRDGEAFTVIAAQPIDWSGWRFVSAPISHFVSNSGGAANGTVDYPVGFRALMLSCRSSWVPEVVEVYFDEVIALYE